MTAPTYTPFAPGSHPPRDTWVAVMHPDGSTTPLVFCKAWNHLLLPPLFSPFDRPVAGWRLATPPFPRVPKEPSVRMGGGAWG